MSQFVSWVSEHGNFVTIGVMVDISILESSYKPESKLVIMRMSGH